MMIKMILLPKGSALGLTLDQAEIDLERRVPGRLLAAG